MRFSIINRWISPTLIKEVSPSGLYDQFVVNQTTIIRKQFQGWSTLQGIIAFNYSVWSIKTLIVWWTGLYPLTLMWILNWSTKSLKFVHCTLNKLKLTYVPRATHIGAWGKLERLSVSVDWKFFLFLFLGRFWARIVLWSVPHICNFANKSWKLGRELILR